MDKEFIKRQKRVFFRDAVLQLLLCLATVFYCGIPDSPLRMLLQVLQSVVAALCGAAIYSCWSVLHTAILLEKTMREYDNLLNGRNFR